MNSPYADELKLIGEIGDAIRTWIPQPGGRQKCLTRGNPCLLWLRYRDGGRFNVWVISNSPVATLG